MNHHQPLLLSPSGQVNVDTEVRTGGSAECSVLLCGDWAPIGGYAQAMAQDPEAVYGDLLPELRRADLAVVNLEAVLAPDGLTPIVKDGMVLQVPTELIKGLTAVPFDVACLANNHSMDLGEAGLESTLAVLRDSRIQAVGVGKPTGERHNQLDLLVRGTPVALINVAEGEEARATDGRTGTAPLDSHRLIRQVREQKDAGKLVIVIAHGGREYVPVPASYLQRVFHSLIEAGADLIVGHHPHVPQGLEVIDGRVIAYSLGNFVLNADNGYPLQHVGFALKARVGDGRIRGIELFPYEIGPNGLLRLKGEELTLFLRFLDEVSRLAADPTLSAHVWDAYCDLWLEDVGLAELAQSTRALRDGHRTGNSDGKRRGNDLGLISGLRAMRGRIAGRETIDHGVSRSATSDIRRHAAAVLRNRFDTPAHRSVFLRSLGRVMDGSSGTAPQWAYEAVTRWQASPQSGSLPKTRADACMPSFEASGD